MRIFWHMVRRAVAAGLLGSLSYALLGLGIPARATTGETETDQPVRYIIELASPQGRLPRDIRLMPGVRRLRRLHPAAAAWEEAGADHGQRQRARWYTVEVQPAHAAALETALQAHPAVARVARSQTYQAAVVPNDAYFAQQYALASLPQPLADINAVAAWDVTTGSSETVIAIVDTGFDATHEDLQSKVWVNSDEVPGNSIDDDGNGYVDDTQGWDFVSNTPVVASANHGTHVAGIAGAAGNNGVGIAGVDWQARLMNVRVLSNSGLGLEDDIIAGILYAAAQGADIINVSIVGAPSPAMLAAIQYTYEQGAVVVAAAGNQRRDTGRSAAYPACAEPDGTQWIIGVGATDAEGEPASFSNYGRCVDISAPGRDIVSTIRNNDYAEFSGTSMSAPLVAGVAGLYKAIHPGASADEVMAAVKSGTPFTGRSAEEWNTRYKGRLDAAVVLGITVPDATPLPTPSLTPTVSPPPTVVPTTVPQIPPITPAPAPASSGNGGGDGGGGGSGGGGGDEPQPEPVPAKKPRVRGVLSARANLKLLPRIKDTFYFVFGRPVTLAEKTYWGNRVKRGDKRTYEALLGAMQWQKIYKK